MRVRQYSGGGTVKPPSWGRTFPGRGGDTGEAAFFMRFEGLNAFLKEMEDDFRDALDEAEEALRESLRRRVLTPSLRLCPIDTGALRASAWVDASHQSGRLTGSVGYDTDYALFVHDVLMWHAPPTQWHYLSDPFDMNWPLVAQDVLLAVREALG